MARAVDGGGLGEAERGELGAHLDRCDACRAAFETQRAVSAWLRLRPADRVSPDFAARLSARLDDAAGWFGIADWRAWTLRLAPVAAVLAAAILFGAGSSIDRSVTIDEWAYEAADGGAAVLWQSDVTAESALESLLTGEQPATSGGASNGR
ncbi:MAG TPA: hypothetical protein VFJ02_06690 [Vicinamibacterales bacterium]|nr:hypothetical protein [Vicinamibacterales bacterium]